jgi:hypothetical protein
MRDTYTWAFYQVVKEVQVKTGYELPHRLESYVTILLANHIDKADFLPKKTFAESFMNLCYTSWRDTITLADTCLFMTGVFPDYHNAKGFDVDYFSNIGKASYNKATDKNSDPIYDTLSKNFDFVRDFISITVNKKDFTPVL